MDISQTKDIFLYQISTAEIVRYAFYFTSLLKGEYDMRCMVRLPFFAFRDSQYAQLQKLAKCMKFWI